MPELPEVETMRRGIAIVAGCRIESLEVPACPRKPIRIEPKIADFQRRSAGRTIQRIDRVGKRVALQLDDRQAIVFEPRMTGLVLLADSPDPLYRRLCIHVVGTHAGAQDKTPPIKRSLVYWDRRGLGSVRLFSADAFAESFGPHAIGPDALDMNAELYRQRLGTTRRSVKTALLDQRAVAGIGNLYASELLFVARLHPERPCNRLTCGQWERLAEAAREVLNEAILYEGSTLSDGTYRNALNKQGGYQNQHRVYGKAGSPCGRCRTPIRRIVQAQRSTFFCPRCQRQPQCSRPV